MSILVKVLSFEKNPNVNQCRVLESDISSIPVGKRILIDFTNNPALGELSQYDLVGKVIRVGEVAPYAFVGSACTIEQTAETSN